MSIIEDFKAAQLEYLQDKWDEFIVNQWFDFPNVYMSTASYIFTGRENIDYETLNSLKRTPRIGLHSKCRVTRYIAAYLPKLNEVLWSGNYKKEQVVKKLKGSNLDTKMNPVDQNETTGELSFFRLEKKKYSANRQTASMMLSLRDERKKSNWRTVK